MSISALEPLLSWTGFSEKLDSARKAKPAALPDRQV